MDQTQVFEEIYNHYLEQIAKVELPEVSRRIGVRAEGDELLVPFFGLPHRVSAKGIWDPEGKRPIHAVTVILAKYVLMAPSSEPLESQWVTYREFKDAAPFVAGFHGHAERPIAERFAGNISALRQRALELAGEITISEARADLAVCFKALPKVPILMLFNDRDEEFPAQCSLLFEKRAEKYLDMECLAMMGWVLAAWLRRA
jgi:hypothetical protein